MWSFVSSELDNVFISCLSSLFKPKLSMFMKFLIANGIKRNRLITKSYGEERPLSLGSNEAAWSKNRRVEIK